MGKTVPSYRQALEKEITKWKGFRKALRKRDREAFDEMMNACRKYASAGGMATRPVLIEAMLLSILLAQQRSIQETRKEVEQLRERHHQP